MQNNNEKDLHGNRAKAGQNSNVVSITPKKFIGTKNGVPVISFAEVVAEKEFVDQNKK